MPSPLLQDTPVDPNAADPSAPEAPGAASYQIPLELLSENGVSPAAGDEVSFTVDGKVDAVNGQFASVTPSKVNGQDVPAEAKPEAEVPSEPDDLGKLEKGAAELDAEDY